MAAEEPPYLMIGTDVSAKYKGAFCEAKVKKVNRVVKCKVTFKNNLGSFMITDDQIKGNLRIGGEVDARHPEKGQFMEAIINKMQDYSQYTVVFDDGDETTLRRTSLCLKSGRHFAESPTLDQFPLTNPEHFGTPVIGTSKFKRKRRSTMNSSVDYESSDEETVPRKVRAIRGKDQNPDLGKVVCVDYGDRRKKENWYPALIVPHPTQANMKLSKEEILVRSFKDGKYYQVLKRDIREFTKDAIHKVENNLLKLAVEKANNYLEKDELPPHWDKSLFVSLETQSGDEESHDSDSDTSDDEPSEEKDRFVAQLYKFMDERGTPINKAPVVSNRDLNLYKLFRIMHKLGGYNKVTNKNKWKLVYSRMGLPQSNLNGPNQIKVAYKRFLQSFEDFYRKLGCTMVSNSRSTRGRHRSDRNIMVTRTREKDTASPKSRNTKNAKETLAHEKKVEDKSKVAEKKEMKSEESGKTSEKPKTPEKKRTEKSSTEEKDEKRKKEEKDRPRLVRSQSLTKEKKEAKLEKARTREDARKEKNESPEKKGTRSSSKAEPGKKDKEENVKDKKDKSPKEKDKKEEKSSPKDSKEDKPRLKKDDKTTRERKVLREKKIDEKSPKEKRENPPREKRERDSSKEDRGSPKIKKEESKTLEDKTPKKKVERPTREKIEEKNPRLRLEDKAATVEASKKLVEEPDVKNVKEEKPLKNESDVKKDEPITKEKLRSKLRERKEDTSSIGEDTAIEGTGDQEENEKLLLDGSEKKPVGSKFKTEEEESPNKGKKRSFKSDDKDDKESLQGLSDSDESFTNDSEKNFGKEIDVGDKVKVKYGRGRLQKVYEAKVLKIEMDGPEKRYYVHYAGWNTRYDEWVRKSFIVANITNTKQKSENNAKNSSSNLKKGERGRPPGVLANTKLDRKNSTSSSSSRATRSEKKGALPLSGGLEPKKRTRRKSGTTTSATDVSQESDTDGVDLMDLDDDDNDSSIPPNNSCYKEELFSDDEEKEKMEDVKRGDITELEKAISVEEGGDDIKSLYFGPITEDKKTVKVREAVSKTKDEPHLVKDSYTLSDLNESQDKLLCKTEDKPVVSVEESVIKQTDLKYPLVSLADIKTEKLPELILGRNNISNESSGAVGGKTIPSQPLTSSENKTALSFAGLIQKPTVQPVVQTPLKTINKIAPTDQIPSFSTVIEKPNMENKPKTDGVFRSISIFGSVLKSSQTSESCDAFEEKLVPKPSNNLFSCILKSEKVNTVEKLPSNIEGKDIKSQDSLKVFEPTSDALKFTHQENNTNSEIKKELESSPLKFCNPDNKDDVKPKDKFDIMLHNTSSFNLNPQKLPEVKDNIFNFSFGSHNLSQEKSTLDQLPSSSSSNALSRIQSKPSDTVDVSKMIPGILERLEKDVVADLKTSDSPLPPPPKEELNFDFLRGSQSISKSLSRSDSSNSLRICESDTNDSNTDLKDLVTGDKLEMPVIVPDTCSSSLEEKPDIIDISKSASETNLSTCSSGSIPDIPKEEVSIAPVTSQPASVITATSTAPVLEIPPSPEKNKEMDVLNIPVLPQESVASPKEIEMQPPQPDDLSKDDIPEVLSPKVSPTSVEVVKEVKPEVIQKDPVENLPVITIKSEKEELFEEIKTITNFAQSSVIKCAPNSTETGKVSESKSPILVKEPLPEIKQEPKETKEAVASNISGLDAIVNAAAMKNDVTMSNAPKIEASLDTGAVADESSTFSQIGKKDVKKKKLGKKVGKKVGSSEVLEKEDKDLKMREGKTKSKKRLRLENNDGKNIDLKSKSKKLKKNKNKKRFSRHEDEFGEAKKIELRDDELRDSISDKIKKKEKKRSDKKFLKCGVKHEEFLEGKSELCKKKKNRKNREKLVSDKKDIFEKKTKKKRKHLEDNQDTDSEKETLPKLVDKKRKKERKKFKVKDCSSSDEAVEKPFKEKTSGGSLLRQDSKSDDPDMSFLLCEEKVPASPADVGDDSSGSSSNEEGSRLKSGIDLLPNVYPCCSRDPTNNLHKHSIDNVLDNTPPTTPSSTESLLSSSPSHERDSFPINYPESTQSGEGESDLFHCNSNRTVARGSEEYRAATTLAFAVCKSVSEKPKEGDTNTFGKSPLSKRKKKRVQRYSESTKSPKHKSSYSRTPKVESYCEDSSGTSPATSSSPPYSNMSFRSLSHRLTDSSSKYFYVPLHEKDPEKRIAVLQEKMAALRKKYMALRAEVIAIDHKRRKARKKVKDSGGGAGNPSVQSEDGQSCS